VPDRTRIFSTSRRREIAPPDELGKKAISAVSIAVIFSRWQGLIGFGTVDDWKDVQLML
jgi:hypothetical protein